MKHFISFQKRKGLYLEPTNFTIEKNSGLAHQLNHQLMKFGYILSRDIFDLISTQTVDTINEIYNDLLKGIGAVVGGAGYEPIYRNFPQSVVELSYHEFAINAIFHYWTAGSFRPEDEGYLNREFKIEGVNYKTVSLLNKDQYDSIFTDIIYSGSSISQFDKDIVDYFIGQNVEFSLSKISFKETLAYVGQRLLNDPRVTILPTKDALNVLRIYSAYCGGDEGLKENTFFKNPSKRQARVLSNTLDNCYNLEEAFKTKRGQFLTFLFYLNPMTKANARLRPNLFKYAVALRNTPKELRTFNSRVEELLDKKDIGVLELLKTRSKSFMRRLDHTVRLFGMVAIEKWLETNPDLSSSVTTYNHFTDRDKEQEGRGAILASQSASNVVTYSAQEPLDVKLVASIKNTLLTKIRNSKSKDLKGKKVFIDRTLYYRPLALNNRASSLSLDGKVNGTVEVVPEGKTIRLYVHWHNDQGHRIDIDLSGLYLDSDGQFMKVGWNSYHHLAEAIVYSGDNTGYSSQNAEYLDITPSKLPANAEWIITEARIYSGYQKYSNFVDKTRAGWMLRDHPEANDHWLPETVNHSVVLDADASTAYLLAFHVPTRSVVYLDLAMGNSAVSNSEDATKMRMFLKTFVTVDNGSSVIEWDKLNQGHVLNVIADNIVENREEADLVFDENTPWESVAKYL